MQSQYGTTIMSNYGIVFKLQSQVVKSIPTLTDSNKVRYALIHLVTVDYSLYNHSFKNLTTRG